MINNDSDKKIQKIEKEKMWSNDRYTGKGQPKHLLQVPDYLSDTGQLTSHHWTSSSP